MTNEERDIIAQFVARVGGQPQQQSSGFGSVPATVPASNLPPVDPEADRFITDQFSRYPEARYRITQMAFVQEAALAEAQNRIKRLQWELDQARQQQAQAPQPQPQQSRGIFGGLFGGGSQPQQNPQYQGGYAPQQQYTPQTPPQSPYGAAPPPPQYPPQYQPGMFQRAGGSGFLGSALTTAAGVAGGVVVGNALMDMFSGHRGEGGFGGGMGGGDFGGPREVNETVINNYGDQGGNNAADPWAGQGAVPGADWANQPGPQGGAGGDAWGNATPPDPGFDTSGNPGGDQGFGGDSSWDNGGGFDDDQNV
jgi:uncharacterized protein